MKRPTARLAAALVVPALLACGDAGPPAATLPAGALLSARTADLSRLLGQLARLEGTPLARRAAQLDAALPDCDHIEAHAPGADLEALLAAIRCVPRPSALEALHRQRGPRAAALVWPLVDAPRLHAGLMIDTRGNAEIELRLPREVASGVGGIFLPGAEAPGPGVLSGDDALLYARLRPAGGLDLDSLVSADGQADRLFRLKSALFAGAVLDGTWEAALYLPGHGQRTPHAALALGFSQRRAAVAAIEGFVDELRRTWPVRRSPFALDGAEGACLLELRILPDFAPCYVATQRALVVGWNPASLRKALDGGASRLGNGGGLLVELGDFAEADMRLAAAAGLAPAASPVASAPWRRVWATGREEANAVRLRIHLETRPDA